MTAKPLWITIILLLLGLNAVLNADTEIKSNDDFLFSSIDEACQNLISNFNNIDNCSLQFTCKDCHREYFINVLSSFLKHKVNSLYIDNEDSNYNNLDIELVKSQFYYTREGGSLFSSGNLIRIYDINIIARLTDNSDLLLWQNEYNGSFAEPVEWETARTTLKGNSVIYNAELPVTNRGRIWEPLVISGILGGLVYLFFASR